MNIIRTLPRNTRQKHSHKQRHIRTYNNTPQQRPATTPHRHETRALPARLHTICHRILRMVKYEVKAQQHNHKGAHNGQPRLLRHTSRKQRRARGYVLATAPGTRQRYQRIL